MSNKAVPPAKARKQIQKAKGNKPGIRVFALLLGAATLIGGAAAALTLLPRLTPTISDPADPDNPYTASVTVTNTGYIPLRSVSLAIGVCISCQMGSPSEPLLFPPRYEECSSLSRQGWVTHNLGLDEKFTYPLNDVIDIPKSGTLAYAYIIVVISYKLPLINLKRQKSFPLVTRQQRNGRLYWYWQ